jgi:hypothetical protein
MKIVKIADGAFFVPSYSEQTIMRAYTTDTTVQSFGYGEDALDQKELDVREKRKTGQSPLD